jgi:hypothetical protein
MPKSEFRVGTLQQIKKLYEKISIELETKKKDNQNKIIKICLKINIHF